MTSEWDILHDTSGEMLVKESSINVLWTSKIIGKKLSDSLIQKLYNPLKWF